MTKELQQLTCPSCEAVMKVRIKIGDHVNTATRKVEKMKYYQYYCDSCEEGQTGWTTTQSDELSIKLNKKK